MVSDILSNHIKDALEALHLSSSSYTIEHPTDFSHGDYSTNVALILAKEMGKNPREVAQEIVQYITKRELEDIEKIDIAGAGFINFYLSRAFFTKSISTVIQMNDAWGSNTVLHGKKIMVEHSQPNPFKHFHIGHLMSNAVGESIARLISFSGADIRVVNYQGDVGLHVAKAIWGLKDLDL